MQLASETPEAYQSSFLLSTENETEGIEVELICIVPTVNHGIRAL